MKLDWKVQNIAHTNSVEGQSAGIPESMIQVMGDWKSDCYKLYVNCPLDV